MLYWLENHLCLAEHLSISFFSMLVITQVADQLKAKGISQLTNGIFRLFQKLLKFLNGTAISTSSVPLLSAT